MKRVHLNLLLPLIFFVLNFTYSKTVYGNFVFHKPDTLVLSIKDARLNGLTQAVINSNEPGTVGYMVKLVFFHAKQYHLSINTNLVLPDTLFGFVVPGDFSKDIYVSNVILNKNSLKWATDELIVSVIIHELLHAYLDFTRDKNLFSDHEEMATDYISLIKNSILQIYPNCNKDLLESLSWGGLLQTSAFEAFKLKKPEKARKIETLLLLESYKFKNDELANLN